jgi:hypothetical protein
MASKKVLSLIVHSTPGLISLSPRERVRVRGNCSGESCPRLMEHGYTPAKRQLLLWATTEGRPYHPKLGHKCIAPFGIPLLCY